MRKFAQRLRAITMTGNLLEERVLLKKALVLFVFIAGLCAPVFSAEDGQILPADATAGKVRESVLSIGFEYGFFRGSSFDGTMDVNTSRTSPAINLSFYVIPDRAGVGAFVHGFVLGFPNKGTVNGLQPEYTEYFGGQTGFIIGPLLNFVSGEKFSVLFGACPSLLCTMDDYTQYASVLSTEASFSRTILDLGIGLDIVFSYAIGSRMRVLAGCVLTVNFLSFEALDPSNPLHNTLCRIRDFSIFSGSGIRPYFSVGFRL